MKLSLEVQNQTKYKYTYRTDVLKKLAERICAAEGLKEDAELSVLLCDDDFIKSLNSQYRNTDKATDVLSFGQETPTGSSVRLLGDIVISLETVARFCDNDTVAMREELRFLFCHALLHLLGYDHVTEKERINMQTLQAEYLGINNDAAWRDRVGNKNTALKRTEVEA